MCYDCGYKTNGRGSDDSGVRMSKVAHYLQEHLVGEVFATTNMRKHFSTDGSIFSLMPAVVVYPRGENDVRKTARFTWQLAERGRVIPITARGAGTDQSGAALGSGIIMNFQAHMHRILELDSKTGVVKTEPGINYGKLQQTLHTHGRFLPPFPSSLEFSTIGGAVSNNTSGKKSLKYGPTLYYVKGLRVVLANGEVIETKKLSKRELSHKLGLNNFEGEVYRALDTLLEENHEVVTKSHLGVSKNTAGYNLADIKSKGGSFDLTPLFVGAQGTLGIVTEVVLKTEAYNPSTSLLVALFDDIKLAQEVIAEIMKLPDLPSSIELIDNSVLELIDKHNPNLLAGIINKPLPSLVLLIEFDNETERVQKRLAKRTQKIMEHNEVVCRLESDESSKEHLKKISSAVAAALAQAEGKLPTPVIDDGIVPPEHLAEYLEATRELLSKEHVTGAIWGSAGDAHLHVQPFLDLSEVGDRQKVFRLLGAYYDIVTGLGGSISSEDSDGRLRGPYLKALYGEEVYGLFQRVKQIFDPYGTMNPGVKINVTLDDIKPLLRHEYSQPNIYQHLLDL